MNRYRIYPTLLDGYHRMTMAEGQQEHDEREQELIQRINRVPSEPSFAASRGTALNNIVDAIVKGERIVQFPNYTGDGINNDADMYRTGDPENPVLGTMVDGFEFTFAEGLVLDIADRVHDAVCQPLLSSTIVTAFGDVELYGYADYIIADTIVDLKTTSEYTVGKYRENWQHRIYPLLAVSSGMMERVYQFQYLVVEMKGTKQPFDGKIYTEDYNGPLFKAEAELRAFLECDFLPWLESHRDKITDNRIFNNQQN